MYKTKTLSILLCAVIMISCFVSCETAGETETTPPQAEDTSLAEVSETAVVTDQEDTSAEEETTHEITTEEVTTSAPEPDCEPMQIPEYYRITATTEFPLIATLGGEKTDVTVRAATMRSKYDVHWIYIDVVRDGKIIFTKTWRAIGQLMATTEKSEFFALLRAVDNPAHATANVTFVTYSLTDAKGKLDLYCVDGFNTTLSVGLNVNEKQPMTYAVQHRLFRVFTNEVKLEDFQTKHGSLCMVLDSLSDPDIEIGAYPSDKLTIYNIERLVDHPFFIEKKEQYDNFYALTQVLLSLDKVAPKIPEGTVVDIDSLRCKDETMTIDGVNYKVVHRTLQFLDESGKLCGKYTDYVSFYDLSILSFEITP